MTPELPFPGSHGHTESPTQRHIRLHPSVEATGLPVDNKSVVDIANLGLTAKIVAGNEKVLETSSGLRLPHGPAVVDGIADAHISSSIRRTTDAIPARTNPQFPPLPVYGSSKWFRWAEVYFFRVVSFILSTTFLLIIVCGAIFKTIKLSVYTPRKLVSKGSERPLRDLENQLDIGLDQQEKKHGKPKLKCDVRYYATRVELDMEEFKVTTEDGFILVLQHIFDPKDRGDGRNGTKRKYPVLLMHGLLQSSGAFCSNDDNSLAFYLCKSGYDVWLGNNRCYYKPEHMVLKSSDPRMWCWNIRQMGIFDLPAFVDYILSRTGFPKLALVAHSQGTTQSFVAMAKDQHPTLGSKISIFCALAPAVYSGSLIKMAHFKFMKLIPVGMFRIVFGIHSFIPFMVTMHKIVPGRLYGWLGYRVFTYLFDWSDSLWSRRQRSRGFMFSPVYVSSESMRWWLGRDGFATHKCILATRNEVEDEERMIGSLTATSRGTDGHENRLESTAIATTRPVIHEGEQKIEARTSLSTKTEAVDQCTSKSPTISEFKEEWQEQVTQIDTSPLSEEKPPANTGILCPKETHQKGGSGTSISCFSEAAPGGSRIQPLVQEEGSRARTVSTELRERAWFDSSFPPLALWICGSDKLVDGMKLLQRFERGAEPDVNLVHSKVISAYEHLDCIWAIDNIHQVGSEVKSCIWDTIGEASKETMNLQIPTGYERVGV
ncbi:hypothetical protein TWF225_006715 [Orbilia oligospora]|uniref:Partial AB-hydrolase lipase domain-containing protein n=1 Tax=Orbilia oligospora TaxID=2813651 RepID=A0A7C8PDE2_ORBOL|nr:hypothetical protein TWF751_010614 [Orbilia oligospora]KAF3181161.1 hypothetical protein TWF225_006715 [Orbilia oligospora]KAF3245347.1 hypothetical protein TWF217_010482 [Orbilia oligospora]KAF3270194.1 hypothetical protein TWF128_004009 [Orbilia oligospora]KAF3287837.1 hypothetical protein TWF132_008220 [Orbilia oligospora]